MGVPNQLKQVAALLLFVVLGACQPIAIRSVTNSECGKPDAASTKECVVESNTSAGKDVNGLNRWITERDLYCKKRQASDKSYPLLTMRHVEVNAIKRQQLAQLARLSCDLFVLPQPDTAHSEQSHAAVGSRTDMDKLQELRELLSRLLEDKLWTKEFHALFDLMQAMTNEYQRLLTENETVRKEMQQKIDALTQLEKDISNRDIK